MTAAALPGAEAGTPEGATLRASRRIPVLVDVIAEAMPHSTTRDEVVAAWAALEELGTHAVDLAALTSEVARLGTWSSRWKDAAKFNREAYETVLAECRALTSEVRALTEQRDALNAKLAAVPWEKIAKYDRAARLASPSPTVAE